MMRSKALFAAGALAALAVLALARPGPEVDPWTQAARNGELSRQAVRFCRSFTRGWLVHADPRSGLLPRNLTGDAYWNAKDSAADNYPFIVLTAYLLDDLYLKEAARAILERETRLTARLDSLPVPFYHCFGIVLANLLCLSVGACTVLPSEHFDALAVLSAIKQVSCTGLHGMPTMFIRELEHPGFAGFNLSSLRTGIMAGAPCPAALNKRVIKEMGCRDILIGYGETEASPITHLTSREDSIEQRIATVGRNLPHQEVKVIDPSTGGTLPPDKVGEICFRGYHVMRGYYGDPEATAKAIDQSGWLHSGDLGTMDVEGYVRITGRLQEMIIRGGENIYPREIEEKRRHRS